MKLVLLNILYVFTDGKKREIHFGKADYFIALESIYLQVSGFK